MEFGSRNEGSRKSEEEKINMSPIKLRYLAEEALWIGVNEENDPKAMDYVAERISSQLIGYKHGNSALTEAYETAMEIRRTENAYDKIKNLNKLGRLLIEHEMRPGEKMPEPDEAEKEKLRCVQEEALNLGIKKERGREIGIEEASYIARRIANRLLQYNEAQSPLAEAWKKANELAAIKDVESIITSLKEVSRLISENEIRKKR
ncbi:MAG TPA: hypothetical protein DIT25_02695 [Candidatus Moranbacteria bacterium]|nr:hypothetical protein [Candidatus Moranbacteria bacterium]